MKYLPIIFISFLLLPLYSTSKDLFSLDVKNEIIATKDPKNTLGLILDYTIEKDIIDNNIKSFNFLLPFFDGQLELKANYFEVYSADYQIVRFKDNDIKKLKETPSIRSYKLICNGISVGVINFVNNEIVASFKIEGRQYEITKHDDNYILFEVSNSKNVSNFTCAVNESVTDNLSRNASVNTSISTSNCIEIAIEVDNYTRNTFGSILETANWSLAILAGVSQIYESQVNTSIVVVYSYIWDTLDPYDTFVNQSSSMLSEIRNYWITNNSSVSRDLVHLLTKRTNTGTGGIAYLDALCSNNYGYGFSSDLNNDTSFIFPNPSYTWNLNVISHEIGHNIGAHHTHWCGWAADFSLSFSGGIIDNCVDVEGGCVNSPIPQLGSIMSYCHTTSAGSILDFHDIVISQALVPYINNASCLNTCDYFGCTDSSAFNFDPNANIDDSSCVPKIFGCIDTLAANFNALANIDDGSCTYCSVLSIDATDISCYGFNDGEIDLIIQNGIPPFIYSWNGPLGFTSVLEDINGLSAGNYTVNVSDGLGCIESLSIQIVEPTPIALDSLAITNVSCYGFNDGNVLVIASGGTLPYMYDFGIYNPDSLSAGNYTVSITDSNNCSPVTASFVVIESGQLIVDDLASNISCAGFNDGSISINIIGGYFPFSFSWSGPNNYNSVFQNINSLSEGHYNLSVIDANGCTSLYTTFISDPDILNVNVTAINVSCNNGMDGIINLFPTGGTTPFNFIWNNGSIFQNQVNVSAGNYSVTVSDANGCTLPPVNIMLTQPSASVISSIVTDVNCFGANNGSIDVSYIPASSVNQFVYNWVGPNSFSSSNEDISNLEAGLYTLTIIENGVCNKVVSYSVGEPPLITVTENINDVSCFGGNDGSVSLDISGGLPIYIINWLGQNPQSLSSGSYQYVITDQNSCTYSNIFVISQPDILSFSSSIIDVSCNNGTDGNANLSIFGGTPPYFSYWPNTDPLQLNAGYHIFIISDDNNCLLEDSVLINEPSPLQIIENTSNVLCNSGNSGSANLLLGGATAPYQINWNGFNNDSLSAGNYLYDVVDGNNCTTSGIVFIDEPAAIIIQSSITSSSCPNTNDGSVINIISGGTPPYFQDWNGSNNLALSSGIYSYIVIDENFCTDSNEVFVGTYSNIDVFETVNHVTCDNFCDGNISFVISNGIPPYLVSWQNGLQADSLCSGVYSYQITDNLSCEYSDTVEVKQSSPLFLNISEQANILTANIIGGIPPYSFIWWSNNLIIANTQDINTSQAGVYYCLAYDSNSCPSDTVSYYINDTGLDVFKDDVISVYPNPSNEYFNIKLPFGTRKSSIELRDILGRIILTDKFTDSNILFISTSSLASGAYHLLINADNYFVQRKIIIK